MLIRAKLRYSIVLSVVTITSARASPNEDSDSTPLRNRSMMALGLGIGVTNTSTGLAGTLQLGQFLAPGLLLIEEAYGVSLAPTSSTPTTSQDLIDVALGLRWIPLEPNRRPATSPWSQHRFFDPSFVYLKVTVGLGVQKTIVRGGPDDVVTTSFGLTTGAAIGWLPLQGRDYAFGIEVRGQTTMLTDTRMYGGGAIALAQLSR